jgi:hypothetical protein
MTKMTGFKTGLLHELQKRKNEFVKIFQTESNWIYSDGDATDDDLIKSHLDAWIRSRMYGASASMVFDYCVVDAIKLIDEIAEQYALNR